VYESVSASGIAEKEPAAVPAISQRYVMVPVPSRVEMSTLTVVPTLIKDGILTDPVRSGSGGGVVVPLSQAAIKKRKG
jgi:hypothetical protein